MGRETLYALYTVYPRYNEDNYRMKSDITWSDPGPQFVGSMIVIFSREME